MKFRLFAIITMAATLLLSATTARAQEPRFELGTTLVGAAFGTGDNNTKVLGIPSSSFGFLNPGVYGSFFVGPFALEPQISLIWIGDGGSNHLVNVAGQVDYFMLGTRTASPYIFVSAGVIEVSDETVTPKSVSGGAGYRMRAGDRLTFRIDGRVTHLTDDGGNVAAFGLSIGGLFGGR
jgi:hypothetical protein